MNLGECYWYCANNRNNCLNMPLYPPQTSGTPVDIQVFTSTGANTWTKPSGAKTVEVILIAWGGAGGSGKKGATLTDRTGGAGGGAGGYSKTTIQASILSSTETVTVGAWGAWGAAQSTNSTNGNAGTNWGNTTFGSWLYAQWGRGGIGGDDTGTELTFWWIWTDGINIVNYTITQWFWGWCAPGSSVAWAPTSNNYYGFHIAWGGSGGGVDILDTVSDGGEGGYGSILKDLVGYAGGTAWVGAAGGNGTAAVLNAPFGGGGGGGGAGRAAGGNAYSGGNGGLYWAGGGGGGAWQNSVGNSWAGGNGANGIAVIVTYF